MATYSPAVARRGFSLIEVLIVAAILSILAGLAVINVQQVMDNQRRKATIAEARQISSALTFARQNTGFFPKLNYLLETLLPYSPAAGDGITYEYRNPSNGQLEMRVYPDFDYIATDQFIERDSGGKDVVKKPHDLRIQGAWDGPYFALSSTSKSTVESVAGFLPVQLPLRNNEGHRWPVDQWGRPYVVYLIETAPDAPANQTVSNVRFLQTPTKAPDFATAVVSYGDDGLPGSYQGLPGEAIRKQVQRLYESVGTKTYRMLRAIDYDVSNYTGRQRLEGYSEQRFKSVPGYTWTGQDLIGVTDVVPKAMPGGGTRLFASDDVVIEF